MLTFEWLKIGDGNDDRFSDGNGEKIAKKSRKSKGKKLFKSRKLAKSGKKLSKSENSPNFCFKKEGLSF